MNDKPAGCTVTVVLPVIELKVAEIVTEPRAKAVAIPPPVIEATVLSDETQVTAVVMSCELPSENFPVAVNCWRVPGNNAASAGVIVIETNIGLVTVRVAVPVTPDNVALMVAEPVARLVAKPEPEIVPTLALDDAQTAEAVTSLLDPSL